MSSKSTSGTQFQPAVYVYEAPVRIWHWVNALAIVALALTGYFIGTPPPTQPGEASDNFLMGYIRYVHFAAGYILIVGFLLRAYWAYAGNSHARQIFMPPVTRASWWEEVLHEMKWYLFLTSEPKKYEGHNPLATLVMHVVFVWGMVFMILTGLALYGEGAGQSSWQFRWFSGWVISWFGNNSQNVHTWHHLGMWVIVSFVIVHIYAAIREDIMSRQSIISSMISGWRTFKDQKPADDHH